MRNRFLRVWAIAGMAIAAILWVVGAIFPLKVGIILVAILSGGAIPPIGIILLLLVALIVPIFSTETGFITFLFF